MKTDSVTRFASSSLKQMRFFRYIIKNILTIFCLKSWNVSNRFFRFPGKRHIRTRFDLIFLCLVVLKLFKTLFIKLPYFIYSQKKKDTSIKKIQSPRIHWNFKSFFSNRNAKGISIKGTRDFFDGSHVQRNPWKEQYSKRTIANPAWNSLRRQNLPCKHRGSLPRVDCSLTFRISPLGLLVRGTARQGLSRYRKKIGVYFYTASMLL